MTLEHFGVISAKKRALSSKGSIKKARKEGEILAVLYGKISGQTENILLFVQSISFEKIIQDPSIMTRVFSLKIENDKNHLVIIKDIQYHPVTGRAIHIDFLEVNDKSIVNCIVPIRAVNQERCEQIKRGGVVVMLHYNIHVVGSPKKMPNSIDIDIQDLKIGDIIFTRNYQLPEGCKFIKDNIPLLKLTGKRIAQNTPTAEATSTPASTTTEATKPVNESKGK